MEVVEGLRRNPCYGGCWERGGVVSRIDPPSVSRSIPDGSVGDLSRCATPWGRGARWPGGAHEPVPVDLEWSGPQFVEGVLHVLGVDGAGLGEGGGGQCVVRGAVDLPGQAPGALGQGLDGGRLEQRQFAAGEAQAVFEVGVELVAVEAADVVADDEALAERLVDGHGQSAAQFGEADEQHA